MVFVDETWTKTNMAPLRGWGRLGERVRAKAPYGHWNTMTFVAALRHDRIDAPWLVDRPMNGAIFRSYVEKVLRPTLQPDDIVIMDNLGSHRGHAIRAVIRQSGAKLFLLPKYSTCGVYTHRFNDRNERSTAWSRRRMRSFAGS